MGLCRECGKKPITPSKNRTKKPSRCDECREKRRRLQQERRKILREAGICTRCEKELAVDGKSSCKTCCEEAVKKSNIAKAIGRCMTCHIRKALDGYTICQLCHDREQNRRAALKESGLCPQCRQPNDTEDYHCSVCYQRTQDYIREMRERRIKAKICVYCGTKPAKSTAKHCEDCYKRERKQTAERNRKRYEAGLCINCGKKPRAKDRKTCASCREKARKRKARQGAR